MLRQTDGTEVFPGAKIELIAISCGYLSYADVKSFESSYKNNIRTFYNLTHVSGKNKGGSRSPSHRMSHNTISTDLRPRVHMLSAAT
jgi:hypothetical protein